ncbi:MAG: hypothetical protein E4H48_08200 [Syntrophobacterales bacterium]|nr:MAG: hypothetical protein E4H48_08200 [Syntrophobacterales bacterium]
MLVLLAGRVVHVSPAYLEDALDRIEQSLLEPSDSFGARVVDTITLSSSGVTTKRGYALYVEQGRLHYEFAEYHPDDLSSLYRRDINVKPASKTGADWGRGSTLGETATLYVNATPDPIIIGELETYRLLGDAYMRTHRHQNPYQMLANPCFAHLGVTPLEVRRTYEVQTVEENDSLRTYVLTKQEEGADIRLELCFSLSHDDMLVRSVLQRTFHEGVAFGIAGGTVRRTVRELKELSPIDGGRYVPKVFEYQYFENETLQMTLTRELSAVVAGGDVDDELFDVEVQLPREHYKTIIDQASGVMVRRG